jgi:type I restriction enzyme R subunit
MRTNFDFLLKDKQFEPFAEAAVSAECVLPISPALCAMACRTAMEFAVKWMYSVDGSLKMPYEDKLITLLSTEDFTDLIPTGMGAKLDYLRKVGNNANTQSKGR